MMMKGLLLFAHGARDPRWADPFYAVAERIRARAPDCAVELAFLEFMAPDLTEAGVRLAEAGCTRIDVVPLFLGAGGHVRRDLPVLVDALRARFPATRWNIQAAVGEAGAVIDAMAETALAGVGRSQLLE